METQMQKENRMKTKENEEKMLMERNLNIKQQLKNGL